MSPLLPNAIFPFAPGKAASAGAASAAAAATKASTTDARRAPETRAPGLISASPKRCDGARLRIELLPSGPHAGYSLSRAATRSDAAAGRVVPLGASSSSLLHGPGIARAQQRLEVRVGDVRACLGELDP